MTTPLIIRNIHVGKAPGFSRQSFPSVQNLQPGLNIVWGANCVGKTTLAQCMRELLWKSEAAGFEAEGDIEMDGERWQLERKGALLCQTRVADGRASEGLWGGTDDSERYFFQLHQLLKSDNREALFQDYIRNKMADGVNLDLACTALKGTPKPLDGRSSALDNYTKAEGTYARLKQEQDGQRGLREQIAESGARLKEARKAKDTLKGLQRALEFKMAEERVVAAQVALDTFPEGVARLTANDPARLEELESLVAGISSGIEGDKKQLGELKDDLALLRVPQALLAGFQVKPAIQRLREDLPGLRNRCSDAELEWKKAKAVEASWRREFQWLLPTPPEQTTLAGMVATLKQLASACEPLRCRLEAADRRVKELGTMVGGSAQDTVEHWAALQACLGNWHQNFSRASVPAGGRPISGRRRMLAIAAAALGVLLALGLARFQGGGWGYLAFLAPLAVWVCLRPAGPGPVVQEAGRRAQEEQAKAEGLLAAFSDLIPRPWAPSAVLSLQIEVARRTGLVQVRESRNQTIRGAADELEQARAEYAGWLDRWGAAALDLGLRKDHPLLDGAQFFHFAEGLKKWLERLEQVQSAGQAMERANLALEGAEAELRDLLMTHGGMTAEECRGDLADAAQAFLERWEKATRLDDRIADLLGRIERQETAELVNAEGELSRFWVNRGFEAPDRDRLVELAGKVDNYLIKVAEWQARNGELKALHELAEPAPAALAGIRDLASLRMEIQSLEEVAEGLEACAEEFTALRGKYGALQEGDALARARSEKARMKEIRDQALQENAVARTVHLLVTVLKEKNQLEGQPLVLQRASRWLQRFTLNRYALGFDPVKGYYAWDLKTQKRFELEELSSGSRVQLLFAIRLAFIEEAEGQAVNMPIFLDEVLATSDDDRAQAMISAILELARDRQVFYFTAQLDEVEKLKLSASEVGYHEVPLDQMERDQAMDRHPLIPVALHRLAIPDPVPDYDAFGRMCHVDGADLYKPVESLHAWHLLTRSGELHGVLNRSFISIAQVLGDQIPARPELRRRLDLLKRAQVLCRQGRGMPFQESDLQDPEFTLASRTAKYWPMLLEQARLAGGDGRIFKANLEKVNRLRSDLREALEGWLEEQGFAYPGELLDAEAVLNRLHQEFPWLLVDSEERVVVERYVRAVTRSGQD